MGVNKDKTGSKRPGRWKPGQSGNPKGRPRISPEYKKALNQLDPMAGQALGDIVNDHAHKDRFRAAEYVWNRNHGMPRARVDLSTPPGSPIEVKVKKAEPTSDELRRELAALLAKQAQPEQAPPADDEE